MRQKNRQKPISVASQEKNSQIATLATDNTIPAYMYILQSYMLLFFLL